jgi:hypothetical protein
MSALGFVGGLGGFANSFLQGYEKSEDREQLQKDREQIKKDREFQAQQRDYEQGQQRRKMDEQKRSDDLRAADSAVQTTETTSAPAEGTVYGNQASVMRDEDGNLMPGAVETSPAQNVTRQRQWDSIYRDYAANRQKSGDTAGALDFTDKANKISAQRASNAFMQLQADAGSKTPAELAREIGKIFDSDPMNGGTKSIEELPNGGVRMTLYNKDTGKTSTKEFTGEKARERLLADFNAYFRPEAYAKLLQSQDEARIKAQEKIAEERAKAVTTPAGAVTTFGAGDPRAKVENDTGFVWTGRLNPDGSREMVRPGKYARAGGGVGGDGDADGDGTGSGSKKGKKTPLDVATSSVMDAIKESAESKSLNADQLIGVQATARELVANAVRNKKELDPYVAGKVALTAVLKPESVKIGYNPATGTFENTVKYNGNEFSVGKVDQATMPESQLKGVAQTFVSKLPADSRADYIKAAAGDKAALDKFNADVVAAHGRQWAERFTAANGRKPTQQDVQDSIARTQSVVSQNIQLVAASGAVEQDKKQRDTATRKQSEATAKAAIGTPTQIMALPPGKAAEIYRQYGNQTDAFQREALQRKMERDRNNMSVGGMRQQ